METPVISIIMPVYNSEKFIEKSIKSVLNQSFPEFELIIINDGSTDQSDNIIKSIDDNRIRYFNVENGGPSKARNLGIKHSKGKYIQFIDSDDYLNSNAMEKLLNMMQDTDLVIASYTIIRETEKVNVNVGYEGLYPQSFLIDNYIELFNKQVIRHIGNKLYKKDIIDKHAISFNKDIKRGEAIIFNINYLRQIQSVFLSNSSIYNYFDNNQSITSTYLPNFVKQTEIVFSEMQSFLAEFNADKKSAELDSLYAYRLISYVTVLFNSQNKLGKVGIFKEIQRISGNEKFKLALKNYNPDTKKMSLLKSLFRFRLNCLIFLIFYLNETKK